MNVARNNIPRIFASSDTCIMASNPRKPLPTQTQPPIRRQVNDNMTSNGASGGTASTSPTGQTNPTNNGSIGAVRPSASRQSPAPMSARAAARKPAVRANSGLVGRTKSTDNSYYDDELRAEHMQLVEDLKQQVQRAEIASDQYRKELEILQMRLQEAVGERNVLEEQVAQKDNEAEAVHVETKDIMRQKKELEQAHNAEKMKMLKERESQASKEQELQAIIQRLNDTIRQKEMRAQVEGDRPVLSRSGIFYRTTEVNDLLISF